MTSGSVKGLIDEGMRAARAGKRDEARQLLLKATELDENNETAWLWLAGVVETPEDRQTCLENVLTINPYNDKARRGLEQMGVKLKPLSTPASAPPEPPAAESAPAPFTSGVDDQDELPTSVTWEMPIPTSSPTQYYPIEEPTPADMNDWIVGLNIKNSAEETPLAPDPLAPPSPMPFVAGDNLFGFEDDEDDLAPPAPAPVDTLADLRASFADGPFEADIEDEPPYPEPTASPPELTPRRAAPSSVFTAGADEVDIPHGFGDDSITADMLDSYDDSAMEELDAEEYFTFIPPEIKASRLPGTVERHNLLLVLAVVALAALNIGALALVINTLTGV